MYKNILIPTDGSELSGEAIRHGVALAQTLGAKITALTITQPFHVFAMDPAMMTDTSDSYQLHAKLHAKNVLSTVSQAANAAGVGCNAVHVEDEQPYEAIIKTAQSEGCDLILMASHGRRGISAFVLGSETIKVLTHSKIPVLVYR